MKRNLHQTTSVLVKILAIFSIFLISEAPTYGSNKAVVTSTVCAFGAGHAKVGKASQEMCELFNCLP